MSSRAPVSAADAITALHELKPDATAAAEILELLNVQRVAPPLSPVAPGVHAPRMSPDARVSPPPPPASAASPPATRTAERRTASITRGEGQPTSAIRDSNDEPQTVPEWLSGVAAFPDVRDAAPVTVLPLFARARARSIIAAAVSTRSNDGPIAVRALIDMICRLEPVRMLPRTPMATVRVGVQLLVDATTSMQPFAQDVDELIRATQDVVGRPRVDVYRFTRSPLVAVSARGRATAPWRLPPRGTPVMIVSGLDIGGDRTDRLRPTEDDWKEMARRARVAGCPLIALVPFAPERWDPALSRVITHVHWDHRMTAGAVRRAIGPGHVTR